VKSRVNHAMRAASGSTRTSNASLHPLLLGLALLVVGPVQGASEQQPHFHRGVLKPYALGPPDILLSAQDERNLRMGRAVSQALAAEDDTRRLIMVQDIQAPCDFVLSRIMDLDNYDRMVSGVDSCVRYASFDDGKTQTVKSTYDISAVGLKFRYYVKHTYDPSQRCMVFSLDYDRRSDFDDSVGYWYVQPATRTSCRVFYSCECKLRGWVPGPVLNMLQKEALKKATCWVNEESLKEWHASRACASNDKMVRFVENVRESVQNVKLPGQLERGHRAATQFVSNVRSSKARASPFIHAY